MVRALSAKSRPTSLEAALITGDSNGPSFGPRALRLMSTFNCKWRGKIARNRARVSWRSRRSDLDNRSIGKERREELGHQLGREAAVGHAQRLQMGALRGKVAHRVIVCL